MNKKLGNLLVSVFMMFILVACAKETPNTPSEPEPEKPEEVVPNYDTTTFSLKGKEYHLPVKYEELAQDGWEANSNIDQKIGSNKKISQIFLRNGSMIIEVTFYNGSDTELDMKDASIAEVAAENRTFKGDVAADLVIHGEFDFNTTPEQFEAKLGAFEKTGNEVFDIYTFNHTAKAKTVIEYYKDGRDGSVSRWIRISNFTNKR